MHVCVCVSVCMSTYWERELHQVGSCIDDPVLTKHARAIVNLCGALLALQGSSCESILLTCKTMEP